LTAGSVDSRPKRRSSHGEQAALQLAASHSVLIHHTRERPSSVDGIL
jgi:hypothetical protein